MASSLPYQRFSAAAHHRGFIFIIARAPQVEEEYLVLYSIIQGHSEQDCWVGKLNSSIFLHFDFSDFSSRSDSFINGSYIVISKIKFTVVKWQHLAFHHQRVHK